MYEERGEQFLSTIKTDRMQDGQNLAVHQKKEKEVKKHFISSKFTCRQNGPLAQLVELPTHDRLVVGSSPTRSIVTVAERVDAYDL